MRTFGPQHFSIAVIAAALAAAPLAAQRSARADDLTPRARIIPARCSDAGCGADYQLAIVAALYPYDDGSIRGPSVLTLVIENRGSAPAPLATLDVAPLARFAVARRAPVAALMPGERTVVEIPLTLDANGGAPCLSITVSPSVMPTAAQTQFYAGGPVSGPPTVSPSLVAPPFVSTMDEGL